MTAINVQRNKEGKKFFQKRKIYYPFLSGFWANYFILLLAEKVAGIVQGSNFRNFITFCGSKKNRMKVFGLWMESTVFWQKFFLRLAKGAFHVSSATLWETMIKVNFTNCGLLRILFVLVLWQKNQSGLSNRQTKCTEEKIREKISVTNVVLNNFRFWAE